MNGGRSILHHRPTQFRNQTRRMRAVRPLRRLLDVGRRTVLQMELGAGLEVYNFVGLLDDLRWLSGEEIVFRLADVVSYDHRRFLVGLDLDDAGHDVGRFLTAGMYFDLAGDYGLGLG